MSEEDKKELVIVASMQLSGFYDTEDLPKLEPLRRKIWNHAEDKGKYSMDEFDFHVYKKEQFKELEDIDEA